MTAQSLTGDSKLSGCVYSMYSMWPVMDRRPVQTNMNLSSRLNDPHEDKATEESEGVLSEEAQREQSANGGKAEISALSMTWCTVVSCNLNTNHPKYTIRVFFTQKVWLCFHKLSGSGNFIYTENWWLWFITALQLKRSHLFTCLYRPGWLKQW